MESRSFAVLVLLAFVASFYGHFSLEIPEALAASSSEAMMVYDNQDVTSIPKYRVWDGSAWGSEQSASAVSGEIRQMVIKYAPTRNEAIMVVGTSTGEIQMQIWDGSAWGSVTVLGIITGSTGSRDIVSYFRSFDVEYEQVSGDAMIIYADGTADPNYSIWNGTTLSDPTDINIPTTGIVNWIELASHPGSDNLAFITLDGNRDTYGMRWDGSAVQNMGATTVWDSSAGIATRKSIDVAFEATSGDILWIWADNLSTDQYYRSYSDGSLSVATLLDNPQAGGTGQWLDLEPNPTPGSDQIMYGVLDAGVDLNTFMWSGTAWSAVHAEHSATTEDVVDMNFDLAFETHSSNPNDAWLLWGNSETVSRKLWDGETSAWGAATTHGDDTAFVTLAAHPNTGAFFAGVYEDDTSASDVMTTLNLTGGSQTWSPASILWSGPVRRNAGMRLIDLAVQKYSSSTEAMMVYDNQDVTSIPKYRVWDGSAWGSEQSASAVSGEIRHMVIKYAPTRNEAIMVVGTSTGEIQMQIWDGSAWGSVTVLGIITGSTGSRDIVSYFRSFDVEYEQVSGDAMIIYADGTADPNYSIWNGTTLSDPTDINIPTTGIVNWIELASHPGSDNLAFITLDGNLDTYGMRWDGSAVQNMGVATAWDITAGIATKKCIDVAFEATSGDILWIWADSLSTDQYYRSYSGGILSDATLLDNPQAGGTGQWLDLEPNPTPGSDQIMYGVLDVGADLNTFIWSGTAWSAVHAEHSAAAEDVVDMNFDLAFETHSSNPNDAWLVWGNGATVSRKLWDGETSAWGAATTHGDDTAFVTLAAHPNTGAFFAGVYEDDTSASDVMTTLSLTGGSQTWSPASILWSGPVRRNAGMRLIDLAGSRYGTSLYEQSGFRLYENSDSTDVNSPLAGLNAEASLTSESAPFRLRLLIGVTDKAMVINGDAFKLQYVDKGSGTCASPSGGTPSTYTDVSDSTLISYYDNGAPTDGATLTSNVNDPTDGADTVVDQSYEEGNNFTNSVAPIGMGQHGNWDFALYPNGASVGSTYCFRTVQSSGAELDVYTVYPSVTLPNTELSFSISDNSVGFGTLNPSTARYATGDQMGSPAETEAHQFSANTNSSGGYTVFLDGETLTFALATIDAIGPSNAVSNPGSEQFGVRATASGGNGTVENPYSASGFAFDTESFPDAIAVDADGDGEETFYSIRYLANITSGTDAGSYSAVLQYLIVARF